LIVKKFLASLILGAAACCGLVSSAGALELAPSATANATEDGGYYPGGLGGLFLTINWQAGNHNIGLLQFDVSSLSPGSVNQAVLDLYHIYNDGTGAQFGIFRNTSAWDGVTTDYSSRPGTDVLPSATLAIADSSQGLHRTVDVTALVQGWVNGDYANYGMTLNRLDSSNPLVYFGSGSNADFPDATPMLIIRAVPEPEAILLMLAGLAVLAGVTYRRRRPV